MLWAVVTIVCLGRLALRGMAPPPTRPCAESRRVDLNRASVAELMTLPGIARSRAAAIVLHRVRHGPFRSIDGLQEVAGIGAVTVSRLRQHLREPMPR